MAEMYSGDYTRERATQRYGRNDGHQRAEAVDAAPMCNVPIWWRQGWAHIIKCNGACDNTYMCSCVGDRAVVSGPIGVNHLIGPPLPM
jgi:hypothetical protein